MKKVLIMISLVSVLMLTSCGKKEVKQPENEDKATQSAEQVIVEPAPSYDEAMVKAYVDIINKAEAEKLDLEELQYNLIYFNQDDTPDLVVAHNGSWVSLYIYQDEKAQMVIDKWPYGAAGNVGYEYLEKQGIINNYNSDFAGALMTLSTMFLTEEGNFDTYYLTTLGAELKEDNPTNKDIQEAYNTYGGYYHGEAKITEEEYEKKMATIDHDNVETGWISGEASASQMIEELQNNIKQ